MTVAADSRETAHIEFTRHSCCTRRVDQQDAGVNWRAIMLPVIAARVRPVSPSLAGGLT